MHSGQSAISTVAVPEDFLEEFGLPEKGNESERITVTRRKDVPGAEIWRAEDSSRYWRVFHDSYAFCVASPNWRSGCRWRYRGKTWEMRSERTQIYEPGEAHHTFQLEGPAASFHVLQITQERVRSILGAEPTHLLPVTDEPLIRWKLLRASSLICQATSGLADSALVDFVLEVFERACDKGEQRISSDRARADHRISRILQVVDARYREHLDIAALARTVGLSETRLTTCFGKRTALPPHQYILARRVAWALERLRDGVKPEAVALDAGFYDAAHFRRVLADRLGFSPGYYQRATR